MLPASARSGLKWHTQVFRRKSSLIRRERNKLSVTQPITIGRKSQVGTYVWIQRLQKKKISAVFQFLIRVSLSLDRPKFKIVYKKKQVGKKQCTDLLLHLKLRPPVEETLDSMIWGFRNSSSSAFLTEQQDKGKGKFLNF